MKKSPVESIRTSRSVEIYRSKNPKLTGEYIDRGFGPAYYEIVVFGYSYNHPRVLLRMPNTETYIELTSGGESSRGQMKHLSIGNPIGDLIDPLKIDNKLIRSKLEMFTFGDDALVKFDSIEFNFMERVAVSGLPEYVGQPEIGKDLIDEMFSRDYVTIPDKRKIAYAYVTSTADLTLIVDQSANKFTYEGMRAWFGSPTVGFERVEITDFVRYRDGGTTIFKFVWNGEQYEMYSPSKLKSTHSKPIINDEPVREADETYLVGIVKELAIDLDEN